MAGYFYLYYYFFVVVVCPHVYSLLYNRSRADRDGVGQIVEVVSLCTSLIVSL